MHRRTFAILISVLALAGVAAGCGDDNASSADSVTKAEFVKQATEACKEVNKETQKNLLAATKSQEGVPASENTEKQLITTVVVPALTKQAERLEAIGAPEGDEEQVEAITDELHNVIEEAEQNPVGVAAQTDPFLEVDQMMKDYGIEACRH
jgi:hypothetical protein